MTLFFKGIRNCVFPTFRSIHTNSPPTIEENDSFHSAIEKIKKTHLFKNLFVEGSKIAATIYTGRSFSNVFTPIYVFLHELGHAVTAKLLFKNSNPTIEIFNLGLDGGLTNYKDTDLSFIGKFLGTNLSKALVFMNGPITENILNLIAASLPSTKKHLLLQLLVFYSNAGHLIFSVADYLNNRDFCDNQNTDLCQLKNFGYEKFADFSLILSVITTAILLKSINSNIIDLFKAISKKN